MRLNVAWRKEKRKMRRGKLNGHSVSLSVSHSLSQSVSKAVTLWQCGTEHITAAEAEFVDLSESDLSCRLAVCCLLSVTFPPNTTAYFSVHCSDGRRGDRKKRQANTHCPGFINQTVVFCITGWISRLSEGYMMIQSWYEFQIGIDILVNNFTRK